MTAGGAGRDSIGAAASAGAIGSGLDSAAVEVAGGSGGNTTTGTGFATRDTAGGEVLIRDSQGLGQTIITTAPTMAPATTRSAIWSAFMRVFPSLQTDAYPIHSVSGTCYRVLLQSKIPAW
ncbi:MAG TPA: hypothetical protein VMH81_20095 [Bryobacteraceae bacterium]|nr:hypothetical protein [Bryobacteraceae bacterium]